MGRFAYTAARTGGEKVESLAGGSDGRKIITIREKVALTPTQDKLLTQTLPPRSKITYCQLYNIDAISYAGTTGTATANRMGIVISTATALSTGTAGYSGVLFIGGTSTAASAAYNGSPAIFNSSTTLPLTNGQFEWTSTQNGYIHLVALSTSTVDPVAIATNTAGHFFFSTNTAATNTGSVAVQITAEVYPAIAV